MTKYNLVAIALFAFTLIKALLKPHHVCFTDRYKAVLLLWILFAMCVSCHTVMSVLCSLVVTCWEGGDLFALLYVMFLVFFVTFLIGVLGQV